MNYITYPHFHTTGGEFRTAWATPTARAIGDGLTYLGGGVLFAATLYLMIVLPGLIG